MPHDGQDRDRTTPCTGNQPAASKTCQSDDRGATGSPCRAHMLDNCLAYARHAKSQGRPIVGMLCEFTPRELILAADAVPVCLCGGSAATIPDAEAVLPAGLCPLIKSTFGYHLQKSNPFLEMMDLIVGETTCDGKKKMYELLARERPMLVLELPQQPDQAGALEQWRGQMQRLKSELERLFGRIITEAKLRSAIALMNRERDARRKLARLMASDPPPLTGRELLDYKSTISGIAADLEEYEQAWRHFQSAGRRGDLADRVRVLLTGVPTVHGAERVVELIEANGGVVVCMENCTGVKPIWDDVDVTNDPLTALAEKYLHLPCSVMTPNHRRLELLRQLIAEFRPHCVIELIWQGCLTYEVESVLVRHLVGEELGLPYLRLVTDYAAADSQRLAVRVQALFETVRPFSGRRRCDP